MFKKIDLIKLVDRIFGRILVSLLPAPRSKASPARKILVIRPGGIGDAVLLLPALQALKQARPLLVIEVLAERRNAAVFSMTSCVDRVYHYDRLSQLLSVLGKSYDIVVDSEQWYRLSAIIVRLVRSNSKVGFATNLRCRMFTHPVAYSHDSYEVDNFRNLLQACLGELPRVAAPWLILSDEMHTVAGRQLGGSAENSFIAVFPGASVAEKQWQNASFRELLKRMTADQLRVVILGGDGDSVRAAEISRGLDVLDLTGRTSLAETAAVLARCSVFVSGDSGLLHLAAALERPTVALFGPSSALKWAPAGQDNIVINKDLDCSPCSKFGNIPHCDRNFLCLSEISVDEVFSAVKKQFTKNKEGGK